MSFGLWPWVATRNHIVDGGPDSPMRMVNFEEERGSLLYTIGSLCHELCKNCWTDQQDAIQCADLDGPNEARMRRGCTLAQPGEYVWTVHVLQLCCLMSNYFDHLLVFPVLHSWSLSYCVQMATSVVWCWCSQEAPSASTGSVPSGWRPVSDLCQEGICFQLLVWECRGGSDWSCSL